MGIREEKSGKRRDGFDLLCKINIEHVSVKHTRSLQFINLVNPTLDGQGKRMR